MESTATSATATVLAKAMSTAQQRRTSSGKAAKMMAGQYAFERVPFGTSFKSASINLPTNCMFVVIPSDGLRPATYAKELYYQGEQSSSADEGGAATNFAAGESATGERLGETSAERNPSFLVICPSPYGLG